MSILFHSLYSSKTVPRKTEIKNWLIKIVSDHKKKLGHVNIIFVDDKKMLELNQQYLKHDYLTDIITFNYNTEKEISGDIYISSKRVDENAKKFLCSFQNEILRVIVHGIFHLLGFDDKTKSQKSLMRQLEDSALHEFPVSGNH
jgi:probable rRNA maturation factor